MCSKTVILTFAEAASTTPAESSVEAPKLLLLLLDVYRGNLKTRGGEVSRASLKVLKALGERLGLDAIVFSDVTAEWIVGQLNEYDWTVKLLVMEWFAKSFGDRAGGKQVTFHLLSLQIINKLTKIHSKSSRFYSTC
jgi:hypothetical protein